MHSKQKPLQCATTQETLLVTTKRKALKRTLGLWPIKLFIIMSTCILLLPAMGGTAFAYSRGNAVNYADRWALSRNTGSYPSWSVDCTDFASQALSAGGYRQVHNYSGYTNDNDWWSYWFITFQYSHSWSVAPDHYTFQIWHDPGGWLEETVNASNSDFWANYDNQYMIGGDELFFDWGQGEGISHVAFQVWSGYSQYTSNWYGDLADQHTTDRYHVSWSHNEVNGNWPTTTIYEVHIDDGN